MDKKTPSERVRAFRERQRKLGRKGRLYYLTDLEHEFLKIMLVIARDLESKEVKK